MQTCVYIFYNGFITNYQEYLHNAKTTHFGVTKAPVTLSRLFTLHTAANGERKVAQYLLWTTTKSFLAECFISICSGVQQYLFNIFRHTARNVYDFLRVSPIFPRKSFLRLNYECLQVYMSCVRLHTSLFNIVRYILRH